jgi:hypothetical protein
MAQSDPGPDNLVLDEIIVTATKRPVERGNPPEIDDFRCRVTRSTETGRFPRLRSVPVSSQDRHATVMHPVRDPHRLVVEEVAHEKNLNDYVVARPFRVQ